MKYKDEFLRAAEWVFDDLSGGDVTVRLTTDMLVMWDNYFPLQLKTQADKNEYILHLLFLHAIAQDELK